jgi:hypothetical protein
LHLRSIPLSYSDFAVDQFVRPVFLVAVTVVVRLDVSTLQTGYPSALSTMARCLCHLHAHGYVTQGPVLLAKYRSCLDIYRVCASSGLRLFEQREGQMTAMARFTTHHPRKRNIINPRILIRF